MTFKDITEFFVATVLTRYVFAPMIGDYIRARLVKTEKDAIAWAHYKSRARRLGHNVKHPLHCQEGRCEEITA